MLRRGALSWQRRASLPRAYSPAPPLPWPSPHSESSSCAGNSRALTFSHAPSTVPSPAMSSAARFALAPSPAPSPAVVFSVSHSSGNSRPYLAANAALRSTLSKEQPRISTLCSANAALRSLKASASAVQPDVSHFGYHHTSTRFPAYPDSVLRWPVWSTTDQSGHCPPTRDPCTEAIVLMRVND